MVAEAISTRKIGSTLVLTWLLVNQKAFGQYSWSLLGEIKSDFCSALVAAPFVSFKPRRKGGACAQPTIAKCLVETVWLLGKLRHARLHSCFFLGLQGCAGRFFFFPVFFVWRRFSPKRKGIYGTSEVQVIFIFSPCEVVSIFGCLGLGLDGGFVTKKWIGRRQASEELASTNRRLEIEVGRVIKKQEMWCAVSGWWGSWDPMGSYGILWDLQGSASTWSTQWTKSRRG